ncbi:ABC transporter [Caulobacter flavus]|uniref:ABC transporter n=1 Tax=Caulobacter flavus TaxID=1679497 RepID=A0A2N5CMQ6_9CAUL|nr:ABC transporter permease [Caulobacter flavus]AYV47096.1 ABC transporter [Caulobacter flavus]PLR07386.1 ABC transporter [Caulobacter flavus]
MLAVLSVELRKLIRSQTVLLALAGPSLITLLTFFIVLKGRRAVPWDRVLDSAASAWAVFLLPMSVTALAALVAHMEHAPRAWDHLRSLPVPRWRIYAAKAFWVLVLVAAMTGLNLLLASASATAVGAIRPDRAPTGTPDLAKVLLLNAKIVAAAVLMIAIQLWTALRYASFVPALTLGIGGTFFAIMTTRAKAGVFFPWLMPFNTFAREAWRAEAALALGAGLGLAALALAVAHLARREVV